ncbi:MAG: glutathione S-transferase [Pseudohongiellaceae bacterium]|jgi:glutathione S-transferase
MEKLTLFGAHLSPYVRKTRLVLAFKGLNYAQVQVTPFMPEKPEEFSKNSPLGKIPLLKVGDNYIADSSVICAFLEREAPKPALLPKDSLDCARTQWFEEYADSHMTSVIGGHLFAESVLAPVIFKRPSNQQEIELAINVELPVIFDYLTGQLQGDYLVANTLTLADIAVCGIFVSMMHSQVQCDMSKWPALAAYIERVQAQPIFNKVIKEEQMIMKSFLS